MPGLQISVAGEAKMLTSILTAENLILKLFTACATSGSEPTTGTVVGDYTEANFTGYASKTLTGTIGASTWSTPTGTPATSNYNNASPQTYTNTGGTPQTILGYYYVGASSGTYYAGEKWQFSNTINPNGTFTFVPQFKLGCNPAVTS